MKLFFTIYLIFLWGLGYITAQSLGRTGAADITTSTIAGTVLMGGGTDVDAAFKWMITKSGGGDFVVIRASGTNAYNSYIYGLGGANSVETFLVTSIAQANDSSIVQAIRKAEAVFFAGGNQADYVNFYKDQALGKAIIWLANVKHVPIGGTSAGDAIQGWDYYSAVTTSVISADVLANPYADNNDVMYDDFLHNPFLQNTICEPHFLTRGRQGRITSFMARMIKDKGKFDVKGIACDEGTAVCVDENGIGMVVGTSKAFFIRQWCVGPETCVPGSPLTWTNGVKVYTIQGGATPTVGKSIDLKDWTTVTGGVYEYWTVNNGTITLAQLTGTPSVCTTTTSLEQNEEELNFFNIYPNPTFNNAVVRYQLLENSNVKILTSDLLGKEVMLVSSEKQNAGEHIINLDISGFPNGIYFVRININDAQITQKLIISK